MPESTVVLIIEAVHEDTTRCTKPHLCITACGTLPSEEAHRTSGGAATQWRVKVKFLDVTADDQALNALHYVNQLLAAP